MGLLTGLVRAAGVWAAVPKVDRTTPRWGGWAADPKNAVLLALASVLVLGIGRRWLQARRARAAVDRLADPRVTPEVVEAVAEHRRAGLMDLFRLLDKAPEPGVREAAGHALAVLWAQDHLIPEEEKAIVRRGYAVTWRARRRYPRSLRVPIPIAVAYGVPFLRPGGDGVGPEDLEWSHRVVGAERAGLETFGPWRAGPGRVEFALDPGDFPADGPHKLVLQARVRTVGLTSAWELDLPHIPFQFEFDPLLAVDALLTLPDDARGEAIARAVRLDRPEPSEEGPRFLDLDADLVLRDPPVVSVATPLPCDLAHAISLEFEGLPGRFPAGIVVLSGQGTDGGGPPAIRSFPIGPIEGFPRGAIDRPGERRLRAFLGADPGHGWADPDVRSIWPGTIVTDWASVRVVRR